MSRNERNHKAFCDLSLSTKSENMRSGNSSFFGKSSTEFQFMDENDDDFCALDLLLSNIRSMQGEQSKNVGVFEKESYVTRREPFLDHKNNASTKLDFSLRLNQSMTLSQQSEIYSPKSELYEELPQKKFVFAESTRKVEELNNAYSSSLKEYSKLDKYPGNVVDESRVIDRREKSSNHSPKLTRGKLNSCGSNNFKEEFNTSNSVPHQKGESFQISARGKCSKNAPFQFELPAKQPQVFASKKFYKCGKCQRKFTYKTALISHMQKHGKPNPYASIPSKPNPITSKDFKCGKCPRKFTYKSALMTHMQKHDKPISYKSILLEPNPVEPKEVLNSGQCQRKFKYKSVFIIHRQKHDKPNPYASILPEPNPAASILLEPIPATSPLPKLSPAASILPKRNPVASILPEPNPVASNHPEPNPDTLKLPESKPVTKTKIYNFRKCPRNLTNELSLNMHKQNHDEPELYKCDQCPKEFSFESQLKSHYVIHSEEKPFTCDHCNYASKWKHALINHIKRYHQSYLETNISA